MLLSGGTTFEYCIAKGRLGMIALMRGTIWGTLALLRTGNSN